MSMKMICMSCKYFKIEDPQSGYCRVSDTVAGKMSAPKKMVRAGDTCEKWEDCGQQYYIRLGWIKAYNNREAEKSTH